MALNETLRVDGAQAIQTLQRADELVGNLRSALSNPASVDIDLSEVEAVQAALESLSDGAVAVLSADSSDVLSAVDEAEAAINSLADESVSLRGDASNLVSATERADAALGGLVDDFAEVGGAGESAFAGLSGALDGLSDQLSGNIPAGLQNLIGGLGGVAGATVGAVAGLALIGDQFDQAERILAVGAGVADLDQLNADLNETVGLGTLTNLQDTATILADVNTFFGLTGESAQQATQSIANFTELFGGDTAGLNSVIRQFGLSSEDIPGLLDDLSAASQKFGVTGDELFTVLGRNGPVFQQFGLNVEESAVLLGKLNQFGIETNEALPQLLNVFKTAQLDGVDAATALEDAFDSIRNAATEADALQVAFDIGLTELSAAGFTAAIRGAEIDIANLNGELGNTTNNLDETVAAAETTGDRINQQLNELLASLAPIGEQILIVLNDALEAVEPILSVVDRVEGLADIALSIGDPVGVAKGFLESAGDLVGSGREVNKAFFDVADAIDAVSTSSVELNRVSVFEDLAAQRERLELATADPLAAILSVDVDVQSQIDEAIAEIEATDYSAALNLSLSVDDPTRGAFDQSIQGQIDSLLAVNKNGDFGIEDVDLTLALGEVSTNLDEVLGQLVERATTLSTLPDGARLLLADLLSGLAIADQMELIRGITSEDIGLLIEIDTTRQQILTFIETGEDGTSSQSDIASQGLSFNLSGLSPLGNLGNQASGTAESLQAQIDVAVDDAELGEFLAATAEIDATEYLTEIRAVVDDRELNGLIDEASRQLFADIFADVDASEYDDFLATVSNDEQVTVRVNAQFSDQFLAFLNAVEDRTVTAFIPGVEVNAEGTVAHEATLGIYGEDPRGPEAIVAGYHNIDLTRRRLAEVGVLQQLEEAWLHSMYAAPAHDPEHLAALDLISASAINYGTAGSSAANAGVQAELAAMRSELGHLRTIASNTSALGEIAENTTPVPLRRDLAAYGQGDPR